MSEYQCLKMSKIMINRIIGIWGVKQELKANDKLNIKLQNVVISVAYQKRFSHKYS